MKAEHIQVFKGKRKYYYRVKSKNGQVLLVSQAYYSKWNCERAAHKLSKANNIPLLSVVGEK